MIVSMMAPLVDDACVFIYSKDTKGIVSIYSKESTNYPCYKKTTSYKRPLVDYLVYFTSNLVVLRSPQIHYVQHSY